MRASEPETPPQPFVVVSFCTEGNGYREEAEARLLPSLRRFEIRHHLYLRPSWGSWRENVFQKPLVLIRALVDFPGETIVWLDSDAELVADPVLFRHPPADFTAHWLERPSGRKLATGTVILRNTSAVRRILELWCADCAVARPHPQRFASVPIHRADGMLTEEALLQHRLEPPPDFLSLAQLPLEYATIFDDVRVDQPVVVHHQASRRLRGRGSAAVPAL